MNLKLLLFYLSFTTSVLADSVDLAHPFVLLDPNQFSIRTEYGIFNEEHEYEKATVMQDLFEYQHFFYTIGTVVGLPQKRQIGLELSLQNNGKLSKEYSPTINLPKEHISYKGFHAAELFFQQHFTTDNEKNKLAFEIRLRGSPLKGKETNNTYQNEDITLSILYSHLHNTEWRLYGDLQVAVIGKKKMQKYDGEKEITDAYSQFGNLIGVQWLKGKYWLETNALFYLTTDYNTRSPSYTRLTDKGFTIGGKLLLGYYLTQNSTITLEHLRQGSNFNVVTERFADSVEFEIETQYTQLGVTWLF